MKPLYAFGFIFAFFVGCFASQVAPLIVPPVRAGTNPTKWEYKCYAENMSNYRNIENLQGNANKLGQEGFEMVTAFLRGSKVMSCFKRELP